MVSEQKKYSQLLLYFCGFIIAISFYCFGPFGFLNIFGARREIQMLLTMIMVPVLLTICTKQITQLFKEPLWLMVLFFLVAEIIITQNAINILNYMMSLIVIGALLTIKRKYVTFIIKAIIVLCTLFSIMGIIQFIILWYNPGLESSMGHSRYTSLTAGATISNISAIEYLGFGNVGGSGGTLFGHQVYRLMSFGSEPSVLVYSFLYPSILALSYSGMIRMLAYPILVFTLVVAASGTIWACILFSLIFFPICYFFKRSPGLGSVTIMLMIVMLLVLITKIDIHLFMRHTVDFFSHVFSISSMPSQKYFTGVVRLSSIARGFENMLSNIFWQGNVEGTIAGLLVISGLLCGFPGLLLMSIILYRMFKYNIYVWQGYGKKGKIFSALFGGTLFQAAFFSSYGWTSFPGLIMLCLLYMRIRDLSVSLKTAGPIHQRLVGSRCRSPL